LHYNLLRKYPTEGLKIEIQPKYIEKLVSQKFSILNHVEVEKGTIGNIDPNIQIKKRLEFLKKMLNPFL
jgi:hypothetical protein